MLYQLRMIAMSMLLMCVVICQGFALDIVRDGNARMVIVIPADAHADEAHVAQELQRCIRIMTGANLPILHESANSPTVGAIFIGDTDTARRARIDASNLDRDGFIIRVVGGNLFIVGHDARATEMGVYFFLQRYGGVRWYIPLEIGEHIPKRTTFAVADNLSDVQVPDWKSRQWSAVARMDSLWERRNLIRPRYRFHHNLLRIFIPSKLYDKHPDWFPQIDPNNPMRYRPPNDNAHSWQPCFSNPEVARYAADVIIRFFDEHPDELGYSIGVNDGGGYCQCSSCRALDDPTKPINIHGQPNYSNRFFTFANRVAEMVSRRHPNKLLGCLAYSYCQEPPSFPLHPNVIPYVTNDRAQWRDPKFKRRDMEHLRAWAKKARQLGVYDYYYGSGYVIPRVFFHISAEAIKFCHSIGVTAWYAEIYSNWALDGPKAWLASQLLWDSDQRVDELLNDYYRNFFGRAAEPMQAYFALCERQWMRQQGAGRWFKGFFDPSQLEMFPPSICMRLQSLLDRAMKLADSAIVRKRIRLYQRGLRYTTLYSTVYHLDKELTMMRIRRAKDVHRVLRMLRDFATATAQLQNYEEAIMREPLLRPVIPFRERARWSPGGNMLTALDTATAKVRRREKLNSIIAEVEAIARELRNTPLARALRAWALVQRPSSQLKQLVANPSFEERAEGVREQKGIGWSTEGVPPGWAKWIRPNTKAVMEWVRDGAHSGKYFVRIANATAACFIQSVPVRSNCGYVCRVYVRGRVGKETGDCGVLIQWKDAKGAWVRNGRTFVKLPIGNTKRWRPLTLYAEPPSNAAYAVITLLAYDQHDNEFIAFDDVKLWEVEQP